MKDGEPYEKTVTYYLGIVTDPTIVITPGESKAAKWLDYESAMATLSFDDQKRVLRDAYPKLELHS